MEKDIYDENNIKWTNSFRYTKNVSKQSLVKNH